MMVQYMGEKNEDLALSQATSHGGFQLHSVCMYLCKVHFSGSAAW